MAVIVQDLSLGELIEAAKTANVRRVLLTDYAAVEPKKTKSGTVLVGVVTVVATALDRTKMVIYRWHETGESNQTVRIGTGHGPGARSTAQKQEVLQIFREEGFEVDDGEWTPKLAEAYLASRKYIVGPQINYVRFKPGETPAAAELRTVHRPSDKLHEFFSVPNEQRVLNSPGFSTQAAVVRKDGAAAARMTIFENSKKVALLVLVSNLEDDSFEGVLSELERHKIKKKDLPEAPFVVCVEFQPTGSGIIDNAISQFFYHEFLKLPKRYIARFQKPGTGDEGQMVVAAKSPDEAIRKLRRRDLTVISLKAA